MIRKFLNWLFGKKQETNKYAPLPTLNDIPASHMAVSSVEDDEWKVWEAPIEEPTTPILIPFSTHSSSEPVTSSVVEPEPEIKEVIVAVEEPKVIHNHKPKRKYHKKKHKH